MKKIYVKENNINEAVNYINGEITFFGFISHIKSFLKNLLNSPVNSDIDDYLKNNGLTRDKLLKLLLDKEIIKKNTKIEDNNGKDNFIISYTIPKKNFERKLRRLYMTLFEQHEIQESNIMFEDGATGCCTAMQGGGLNPDAGQYTMPFGKVQRRKIYVTQEQYNALNETLTTYNAGNYQYDVPFQFNDGKDPSYNHKNICCEKYKTNKKKGIRKKTK